MPSMTLGKLQVYRLLLFPFVEMRLIAMVTVLVLYLPALSELERKWGTLKTAAYFFFKNLEIGLVYCIVCAIISNFYDPLARMASVSLWPVFLCYMTQKSQQEPEEPIRFYGTSLGMKTKYYPIVLAVIYLALVNTNIAPIDGIVAIGLGFVGKFMDLYYFDMLNDARINELEQKPKIESVRTHPRFISVSHNLNANLIGNDSIRDIPLNVNLGNPHIHQGMVVAETNKSPHGFPNQGGYPILPPSGFGAIGGDNTTLQFAPAAEKYHQLDQKDEPEDLEKPRNYS